MFMNKEEEALFRAICESWGCAEWKSSDFQEGKLRGEDHGFYVTFDLDEFTVVEIEFHWEGRYFLFLRDFGEVFVERESIDAVLSFLLDLLVHYESWEPILRHLAEEVTSGEGRHFSQNVGAMVFN